MENNNKEKTKHNIYRGKWIIFSVLIIVALIFGYYENHHLLITDYSVSHAKITSELSDYRILQISDFHNAIFGINNNNLIDKIDLTAPDIIVITGDLVDSNHTNIQRSLDMISRIASKYPVYYVTGNHEYWLADEDREKLLTGLKDYGVVILDNEAVTINVGEDSFSLIGLDDKSLLSSVLPTLISENPDELNVVLAHEPQYFNNYCREGADIVITGHAHGGQFILPIIGAVYAPDQGFRPKYTSGVFIEDDTTMVVSRGLGNSVIPVRLFNNPELVVITLN